MIAAGSRPLPVEATRYATALYELANEQKALSAVEGNLQQLKTYLSGSRELRQFLLSPLLRRTITAKGLAAVLEKGGADKLTQSFFKIVAMNGRARDIPNILEAFFAILAERRGELRAEVTSSRELTAPQQEALQGAILKAFANKGARVVKLQTRIDPALLGGIRVQVGSFLFDGSLQGQLRRMESSLKNAA